MPLCASLNVFPYHDGGFRVLQGILGRGTQGKIVEEKLYRPGALKKRLLADGGRDNSVENQPSCARHGIVGDYFQGARAVLLDHSPAAALHAGGAKIEGIHLGVFLQELTDGAIPASAMGASLSIAIAASVGLAMLRVLAGIPVMYFLIPGYVLALLLTLVVPKIFTAIAFDSGGVASGPMTATFLLPFAQGACSAVGGDIVKDAFGVVAMVAMTPLITIQVLGVIYQLKSRKAAKLVPEPEPVISLDMLDDDAIIEL